MDKEGCRGTMTREMVEDKENDEAGDVEGGGAARQGGREIENVECF